jgi:hypothetical protein
MAVARGIKTDYVVPATKQATLDRLAKFAAHSELGAEIAGSFTFEQAPAAFGAFVAGTLPGKYVMKREDK